MPREREPFRAYDEDRDGLAEGLGEKHPLPRNEFECRFFERCCRPGPHRPSECTSVQMMEHLRADATVEVHHEIPGCLLRLRDRAEAHTEIDGEGIQAWLDYELEALRSGVDPDVGRNELAAMIEGSTGALSRDDHCERTPGTSPGGISSGVSRRRAVTARRGWRTSPAGAGSRPRHKP